MNVALFRSSQSNHEILIRRLSLVGAVEEGVLVHEDEAHFVTVLEKMVSAPGPLSVSRGVQVASCDLH